MPEMIDRGGRLRVRREFLAVQDRGRRVTMRYFVLIGAPNQVGVDRLGIIASRKLGGAVVRNRAKRRLRELFRHRDLVATAGALDVVAIPRRELLGASFTTLEADFGTALKRLRSTRFSQ
jgi:ribonuclease P protein component